MKTMNAKGFEEISAFTAKHNIASQMMMKKCGLVSKGVVELMGLSKEDKEGDVNGGLEVLAFGNAEMKDFDGEEVWTHLRHQTST